MGFPYRRKTTVDGITGFGPSIILYDDMEKRLKWDNEGSGNATLVKASAGVYNGDSSIKANSDAGVIAMGDELGASRSIIVRPGGIVRINLIFIQSHPDEKYTLEWRFEYIKSGKLYTVSLTYFTAQEAWLYLDEDGNYQTVEGTEHILSNNKYHFLEIVFDTRTHKFISFTIDNTFASLHDIPYKNEVDASNTYGKFTILGTLLVGVTNAMGLWIDNISIIAE